MLNNFSFDALIISSPLNFIDDDSEYDACGLGSNCKTDIAVTDLPEPDSPTSAIVLLFSILKLMLSTALNSPSLVVKLILKLFISNILFIKSFYIPLGNHPQLSLQLSVWLPMQNHETF